MKQSTRLFAPNTPPLVSSVMNPKLSVSQLDWLRHAQLVGYEQPFCARPIPSLVALERWGLIERDPSSRGLSTRWRITAKGLEVKLP